jgi:predicted kinase
MGDNVQRIIILEGPDGCGKTNIGQELSRRTGIPYFKPTLERQMWKNNTFKTALEYDQPYIAQFLKQTGCSVIMDRAYPSEWVYSKVYKRETNPEVLRQVDHAFACMGADIIVAWRDDYSKNRKDDLIQDDKLVELSNTYFEFMKWTECNKIPINVNYYKNDLDLELKYLLDLLKR